jgi:YggT family protein
MPLPVFTLLAYLLQLYSWVVIAAVVMSWLVAFHVINTYNRFAAMLVRALDALTEPLFRQIRRVIPPLGGLDFSPFIVLIAIWWIADDVLPWLAAHYAF